MSFSGLYKGVRTDPGTSFEMDLRVDVDERYPNSPVLNQLSGDIYETFSITWMGVPLNWRVYQRSFHVKQPIVDILASGIRIEGDAYLSTVKVEIEEQGGIVGPALVEMGGLIYAPPHHYQCDKVSDAFRSATLEIDVVGSVNHEPVLPRYDTHAHSVRPMLPQRELDVREAFLEAGIDFNILPERSVINDRELSDADWTPAELHDAMESYFSQLTPGKSWSLWGLVANGRFRLWRPDPSIAGIMFDSALVSTPTPERQGFAVFRSHDWFKNIAPRPPANDAEAASMRAYLYTFVHEIGHAFSLVHSADRLPPVPKSLSWMNNPTKVGAFWNKFRFRFDEGDLMRLRHGSLFHVIFGGDPFFAYPYLDQTVEPPRQEGQAPVELLVRSKRSFDFMEPVNVELRLLNLTPHTIELSRDLRPEFGAVTVYIRRPDGSNVRFSPAMCLFASPSLHTMRPRGEGVAGEDRFSQEVPLSFGAAGHTFAEPGEYAIVATYRAPGGFQVVSAPHRLRIGRPFSRDEERLAADYFTTEAGLALYFGGSDSRFLREGTAALKKVAKVCADTAVGAHLNLCLAEGLARPFHEVRDSRRVKVRDADPAAVLKRTSRALERHSGDETTLSCLAYHRCVRTRSDALVEQGKGAAARKELRSLMDYLRKRGVKQAVLDAIRRDSNALDED